MPGGAEYAVLRLLDLSIFYSCRHSVRRLELSLMGSISKYILKRMGLQRLPRGNPLQQNLQNSVYVLFEGLERSKGKLGKNVIRECDDYAREILGDKIYAPWLYVYSIMAGKFKEGWIPDNYYGRVVIQAMQGNYRSLSVLKALHGQLFDEKNPLDLVFHVSGLFLDSDLEVIDRHRVKDILFREDDSAIYKIEKSGRGLGIRWFHKNNFDIGEVEKLSDGVFQKPIRQHPYFAEFTPASVVTMRLTTVIEDSGKCSLRSSRLKIGRGGDDYVKADSYVAVFFNPENGKLDDVGYLPDWTTSERHPESHVPFAGKTVPQFDKCIEKAIELHMKIPYVRCLGWDLTVDSDDRVRIIELNTGHNGINISEAVHGPCFADMGWEKLWRNPR